MKRATLTANQFVLLEALRRGTPGPGVLSVMVPEAEPFPSQRAWLATATALYLERWPGGSNPEWGPQKAIGSVLRRGWVSETQEGRALVPALTGLGLEVLRAADPSTIRPKFIEDVLAEIRKRGAR